MNLYIKNMVCNRCKLAVTTVFDKIGIAPATVELGEVEIEKDLTPGQHKQLETELLSLGFELINDKKASIIERVKTQIISLVHQQQNKLQTNLSDHLSQQLDMDYNTLSKLFSEVENTTIEQYMIAQKVEKIKELIMYDELSLSEIADRLNYSSLAYLSNQFKKVTGFTPTYYKQLKVKKRKQIDKVI